MVDRLKKINQKTSDMSLLTSQMTLKMSTAYSGLSALIMAATSQLGDLAEDSASEINTPEGTPPLLSNPRTPTLEGVHLDLDRTSSWYNNGAGAATVTPLLSSNQEEASANRKKLFFPEVLMLLLANPANEDIVTFLPDGKYFAIRRSDFSTEILYKYFQLKSFEDFLQEIRGWGFMRVNGNSNLDCDSTSSNINNGNCHTSSIRNCGTDKADIYVLRHPHFEKNRPVDMGKIRFRNEDIIECESRKHFSPGGTERPRTCLEKNARSELNSTKRQLAPSDSEEFDDSRQRPRVESKPSQCNADPFPLLASSSDLPPLQIRRRSSLELRGVAQAITASKLHITNNWEAVKEEEGSNKDSLIIYDTDSTIHPESVLAHTPPQLERKQSTASSLVDGGVETATQNIVTDAIEALLFDESHTRETYHRHEKELSVSSLPGVVPISKQLFSASDRNNATNYQDTNCKHKASYNDEESGFGKEKTNNSNRKKQTNEKPQSLSSPSSPLLIHAGIDSLEDASRNNGDLSSSSAISRNDKLRVIVPKDADGEDHQREFNYGPMVVSPARMEAAAALVSQSRNKHNQV